MGILDNVERSIEDEKRKFLIYEALRNSGTTNMFALREVCDRTGLDKVDIKYIQGNYSKLAEKYLD